MSNTLQGFSTLAAKTAVDVDQAFWVHMWVIVILGLSVILPMLYFVWKFRADKVANEDISDVTHNTKLELIWTLIPTAMLMVLFYYGYSSMKTLRTMPAESESIVMHVEGKKWSWMHTYPANKNGFVHKSEELYVPKDKNVILSMEAPINDVIHSYFVPAFRIKEDVVPGRVTKQWFNATKMGTYDVECAEYCGTRHSYMLTKIHVIPEAEYNAWFEGSSKVGPGEKEVAKSKGHELYDMNGCSGCHSIDSDTVLVGPGLKGIGTKYDAQYLKDAIINPNKDVPQGFSAGIMPPFSMSDEDVAVLVDYITTGK